jgi:hypothetical protein
MQAQAASQQLEDLEQRVTSQRSSDDAAAGGAAAAAAQGQQQQATHVAAEERNRDLRQTVAGDEKPTLADRASELEETVKGAATGVRLLGGWM